MAPKPRTLRPRKGKPGIRAPDIPKGVVETLGKKKARTPIPDTSSPKEINDLYIEPIETLLGTMEGCNTDVYHWLAGHILLAEGRCFNIKDKALCNKNAPRCVWNDGKWKFWKNRCQGFTFHELGINNFPPTMSDIRRLDKLHQTHELLMETTGLTPTQRKQHAVVLALSIQFGKIKDRLTGDEQQLVELSTQIQKNEKAIRECTKNVLHCPPSELKRLRSNGTQLEEKKLAVYKGFRGSVSTYGPYVMFFVMAAVLLHQTTGLVAASGFISRDLVTIAQTVSGIYTTFMASGVRAMTGAAIGGAVASGLGLTLLPFTGPVGPAALGMLGSTIGAHISDPILKCKLRRLPMRKGDLNWPIPMYEYQWNEEARKLYGLGGDRIVGMMATDVKQICPGAVGRIGRGKHLYIRTGKLLTCLLRYRRKNAHSPRFKTLKGGHCG